MKVPFFMSLGAVGLLIGTAGVVYSALSSQWINWKVNRNAMQQNRDVIKKLEPSFERNPIYFSRNYGLYHICFPERVPSEIGSFSYFWESCIVNHDYYPDGATYNAYTTPQIQRYYLMWLMLVCYVLALVFLFLTMIVGVLACWKQNSKRLGITTVFIFLGILFLACVALLWHFIQYYEVNAIKSPSFPLTWDTSLRQSSEYTYGIAYTVFMASCVALIVGGLGFAIAWYYVKKNNDEEFDKQQAYLHYVNNSDKQLMPYAYANPYTVGTYYPNYYSQGYPTMNSNNYYGYLTYGGH